MKTTAIILFGGKATRYNKIHKGLLKINNQTLINRLIKQFQTNGVNDIIVVVRKKHKKISGAKLVVNNVYVPTNGLSLKKGIEAITRPSNIVVCSADTIFENSIIGRIVYNNKTCYAIDPKRKIKNTDMGGVVKKNKMIAFLVSSPIGELGLFKIMYKDLKTYYPRLNNKENCGITLLPYKPEAIPIKKYEKWYEIDTPEDYEKAKIIFESKIKLDNRINIKQLEQLMQTMNFPGIHLDKRPIYLEKIALKNSVSFSVKYKNKLIGYTRIHSDGVFYFGIWDVLIHPQYQGYGLGYALMTEVMKYLKTKPYIKIYLFSAKGKENFYSQFGFNPTKAQVLEVRND